MVVRSLAGTSDAGKFEAVVAVNGSAHFGLGVTLRDEPSADAARNLANTARLKTVEADAVDLPFLRCGFDADFHLLLATASQVPRHPYGNYAETLVFCARGVVQKLLGLVTKLHLDSTFARTHYTSRLR